MACAMAAEAERFVAGQLGERSLPEFEGHIEACQECYLRVAAAVIELSGDALKSLRSQSADGSRLRRCLEASSRPDNDIATVPSDGTSQKSFGPYLVTGFLGMGGMSVVFKATHRETGDQVAVKTVRPPYSASSLAMLRQEIEFLREARHPGIVNILDAELMAEDPWYAMELLEGQTLQEFNRTLWGTSNPDARPPEELTEVLAAGGRLSDVLELFIRLCDPLGFIHGAGMVHGDVKPANVFLRGAEQPVLMDFGLASRSRGTIGREALDITGRIRGTLPYMAPETIRGRIPDARADLYAIGCMLYEAIVGVPPFVSGNGTRIIDMHLSQAPSRAGLRVSGVPRELDDLLLRLLAKVPGQRFGHARALGQVLDSIADSLPSGSTRARANVASDKGAMPLFRPPLVGREDELRSVLACLQRAGHSMSGTMFLVSGESGIGKTFFTAEVAQRALLAGIRVITSECVPVGTTNDAAADADTTPLQGFRKVFERLRDRCLERGAREIELLFGDRLGVLANYLPALRQMRLGEQTPAVPPQLPTGATRERIVAAVVDTLAAFVGTETVLLALDDLQWADDLTLAVLERLDDELFGKVPLIVLATYRSDETHSGIRRLIQKPSTRSLDLGRLASAELSALVAGMLSMTSPPQALVNFIDAHAEGVPFFAAEYLRALVAAEVLLYQEGAWSIRTGSADAFTLSGQAFVPRPLQELIRSRLSKLPGDVVELLEVSAVVGRRFSAALIARIVELPEAKVAALLEATVTPQVTEEDGSGGFRFLHDKIRETLYAGLLPERRERLHLAAGRALDRGQATPPDHFGQIGYHLRNAGRAQEAIDYFERAATHALALAANADANRFLEEAIELEAVLPARQPNLRRARWLRQRGDALGGLGMMAESAAALRASAALLRRPFPSSKIGFAFKLTCEIFTQIWHRLRPRGIGRRGPQQVETNAEVVRVFERMHEVAFYLGRDADLVLSTTVSLNASERAGTLPNRAVAYSNAAMMAGVLQLSKLAEHYFRLARAALTETTDLSIESWVLEMEGHYNLWQGHRSRGNAHLERAARLARDGGFYRRSDEAESLRNCFDAFAGFHEAALKRATVVEVQARKRRDRQVECWALLEKAEALLLRGDLDASLRELRRAEAVPAAMGRPEQIWATATEAAIAHDRGDLDGACKLVDHGVKLSMQGMPVHSHLLSSYDRLAEVAVATLSRSPRPAALTAHVAMARRACTILERAARTFPIARPSASLHRGSLDLALRRRSQTAVLARWEAGAAIARTLGQPYAELRLHLAFLRWAPPGHPSEARARGRATALIQTLALEPRAPVLIWPLPSGGSVEVERER